MNIYSPFTGSGVMAGSTERADLMSKLQSNNDAQVRAEKARIQYMRDEEARRREMEQVPGPEALPGGTPASMVAGLPVEAAAPTFAGTPVPDAQRNQYIARNVTPAAAPNQSDAESARLARQPLPALRPGDPIVGGDFQPGTGYPMALRGPAGEQQRLADLRSKNPVPAPSAGGNESMAEANRVNANRVPAAAAAPAEFDALAQAVKMVESGGDPNAVSPKGAVGTMQTMPETLRDPGYGVRPAQNNTPAELERVGRDYLQAMIAKYPNRIDHALAAYNWGPGNTDKWIAAGADPAKLPKETRDYIPKVLGRLAPGAGAPAQTAAAPAPQGGMPAAAPTQPGAAQPAAGQTFSPEQVTQVAAATQQELRMTEMRLAEINRRLSYAPTLQEAQQLRAQANDLRFGAFNAQLKNAAVQASTGNQQAVAQLATAAGVQYAQTPQGYVAAQLNPATGQYVATTRPAPLEQFVNTLYSEATGAAAKAREAQRAALLKVQGEIAVEDVKGKNAVIKAQADAQAAIQKAIVERRLTEGDIKGMEFDPISGKAYVRTNSGVFSVEPGQDLGDGMMSEPQLVPLRGLAG